MNKYINESILEWMLEKKDPDIRYLTLMEFPDYGNLNHEYKRLESFLINSFIIKNNDNILGDKSHFDLLYKGTVWQFAEAVERGLDIRNIYILKTADYIIKKLQLVSGGFSFNWDPPLEAAGWTGNILYYLLKSNYNCPNLHKAAEWIIKEQGADGSWKELPLQKLTDYIKFLLFGKSGKKKDIRSKSCFFSTFFCLAALVEYFKKYKLYKQNIESAVNYVLSFDFFDQKFFRKNNSTSVNNNILKFGYPIISQLDILKFLLVISEAGFFNHPKVDKLFNLVLQKRNSDGSWNYESKATGMLKGNDGNFKIAKPNKWVTLNALRLMKYAEKGI